MKISWTSTYKVSCTNTSAYGNITNTVKNQQPIWLSYFLLLSEYLLNCLSKGKKAITFFLILTLYNNTRFTFTFEYIIINFIIVYRNQIGRAFASSYRKPSKLVILAIVNFGILSETEGYCLKSVIKNIFLKIVIQSQNFLSKQYHVPCIFILQHFISRRVFYSIEF